MEKGRSRRQGFTLVELLVVIAIIGVLVSMLLPAVQAAREAARRMSCGNNMKQLGLALHQYHDKYKLFPPDAIYLGNQKNTNSAPADVRNFTWCSLLLPYMEQQPLHDRINFSVPGWAQTVANQGNGDVLLKSISLEAFVCPSDIGTNGAEDYHDYSVTSYAGNAGWDGHRRGVVDQMRIGPFTLMESTAMSDIRDGTTHTILLGEVTNAGFVRLPGVSPWAGGKGKLRANRQSRVARTLMVVDAPFPGEDDDPEWQWVLAAKQGELRRADGSSGNYWWHALPYLFPPIYVDQFAMNNDWPGAGSLHPGGAQFTLCDASVRFIPETISTGDGDDRGRFGNIWVAAHTIMGASTQGNPESEVVWP